MTQYTYVSPQDRAIADAAERQAEMNARQAEKIARYTGSGGAGGRLFRDERRAQLDELVRARLNRERGHVAPVTLKEAQDAEWAKYEPIVNEKPDRPLSVNGVKSLVAAAERGPVSAERRGQLVGNIKSLRSMIYETEAEVDVKLARMNAYVAKERPLLNAYCKATGAGDSVPLALELLAESADSRRR